MLHRFYTTDKTCAILFCVPLFLFFRSSNGALHVDNLVYEASYSLLKRLAYSDIENDNKKIKMAYHSRSDLNLEKGLT